MFASIRFFRHLIGHVLEVQPSRSSRGHGLRGIHIPLGHALVVTAGLGRAQRDAGAIAEIRPGDVAWFSPGEKHWHGVFPTTAMTHIAIQEKLDGKTVDWLEHVSEEQYSA
jgi:hypothetical protein